MSKTPVRTLVVLLCGLATAASAQAPPSGNASIRAKAGPSEIVVTTTERLAGAIHSLTWNGKEFIDSTDHGRQLQSASNLDCPDGSFIPEVFNPTEAGSRADHVGPRSSSKLLTLSADGLELRTSSRMAFWLAPGEKSEGHPACNDRVLSDHLLTKRVRIGHAGNPHVIEYDITFTLPASERHSFAQFEAVTGYMPPDFARFWKYDAASRTLLPLDDGPGEQPMPVVLATANGSHAMGIFTPEPGPGYGRWRFRERAGGQVELRLPRPRPEGGPAGRPPLPDVRRRRHAGGRQAGTRDPQRRVPGGVLMTRGRLEAFSDGVLAIIITIMVLELKVPQQAPTLAALRPLVPVFLGYVLSFVYVGIYWNNHHHLLQATPPDRRRGPLGQPPPAVLALAHPVRHRPGWARTTSRRRPPRSTAS